MTQTLKALQLGEERWDVAEMAEVVQTQDGLREARYGIRFGDGSCRDFILRFGRAVVTHRLIDPTYNEIDSWSDDILKTLPYTAADGGVRDGGTFPRGWRG